MRGKQHELLKDPGEENPAELFTQHLESEKKLTQLISLFNCQMRDGRAASAPQLKRAQEETVELPRAETAETDYHLCSNRLPHQFSRAEQQRRLLTAVPTDELYGEEDQTPEAELADPLPLLERRFGDASQSRVMSKLRRRDCNPTGRARQAPDAEKAAAEVPSARQGRATRKRPELTRKRNDYSLAALM